MTFNFYQPTPPPKTTLGRLKRWVRRLYLDIRSYFRRWNKVQIPVVRKQFSTLAAKDICSVQPMTGETGLVFEMVIKYGKKNNEPKRKRK